MSFNENGQNENQNWKIQNQTTRSTQQHQFDTNNIQSTLIYSDDHRPNVFNATSENVGNKPLKTYEAGEAHARSGVTTVRTDFSGLFTGKQNLTRLYQISIHSKCIKFKGPQIRNQRI